MTDEELVLKCQNGDSSAEEELYGKYKPIVRKIARRYFLTGCEIEDLVQEGMLGLFSAVKGFKQRGNFPAYAYKCIENRIFDAVRKSTGAKYSALNNFLPIVEVVGEWIHSDSPEDEIIKREDKRELLHKMRANLSSLEFKAFEMYSEGMTMAEISSSLNKSVKSVDNALNRAKNKLQKLFSSEK